MRVTFTDFKILKLFNLKKTETLCIPFHVFKLGLLINFAKK